MSQQETKTCLHMSQQETTASHTHEPTRNNNISHMSPHIFIFMILRQELTDANVLRIRMP